MKRCKCGAYRLAVEVNGELTWIVGCRACDTIARLNILLESGVRVTSGSGVTMDVERLKRQRDHAEEEIENLRGELVRVTDDRNEARLELMRTKHSAQVAIERMRQGHHVHVKEIEWN